MLRFDRLMLISGLLILSACSSVTQVAPIVEAAATAPVAAPTETTAVSEEQVPPSSQEEVVCDGRLTPPNPEGPFYKPNTPERSNLIEAGMGGIPLLVRGKILDQDCRPIAGAMIDFWQTDENGNYDNEGYVMRGHQFSDEGGNYLLETVLPGVYPGRTPHIHLKIFAPDGRELLTSQLYFSGVSNQTPDIAFSRELLARDLEAGADGRRQVSFDFVVSN